MHLSFLPIGTSGVPLANLLWFEGREVFLTLLGAVVLAGLAIVGASVLSEFATPKVVWPRPAQPSNRKVLVRNRRISPSRSARVVHSISSTALEALPRLRTSTAVMKPATQKR